MGCPALKKMGEENFPRVGEDDEQRSGRMAKKKAAKDAAGKFKKRMDALMGEGNWQVTIKGNPNKAEVTFGDDAPIWGTEWCACENRDAEMDGYCADCGGKIRQS